MDPTESLTVISSSDVSHVWTIKNWHKWLDCSDGPAEITSGVFTLPTFDQSGMPMYTQWVIKAATRKGLGRKVSSLAFRLTCLSHSGLTGSYRFTTLKRTMFGGLRSVNTFDPVPIDAASKWATHIRYHPSTELVMKVSISVVVPNNVPMARLPKKPDNGIKSYLANKPSFTKASPQKRRSSLPLFRSSPSPYIEPISFLSMSTIEL